jgi:hypothetical protein
MNKVYKWGTINYPENLIGTYQEDISPDRFLFYKGRSLSKDEISCVPTIIFETEKKLVEAYDTLLTTTGSPVISGQFADLLLKVASDDIQLFDVRILCADGELEGYKIINITRRIKGIDHERSVYYTDEVGGVRYISHIKRLFFKESCMGKYKIAREEESMGQVLVNQEIYDLVQNKQITGIRLIEPDDYYRNLYK